MDKKGNREIAIIYQGGKWEKIIDIQMIKEGKG